MAANLNGYFYNGPVFHCENDFNKYLVNFYINTYVNNDIGASMWDNVSKDREKAYYKRYPSQKLLYRATIYKERYQIHVAGNWFS